MQKNYLIWNVQKFEQNTGIYTRNPLAVLREEARRGDSCSTVVTCDEDMIEQIKTLIVNEFDADFQCADLSHQAFLFVYRGADYADDPHGAHKDGALYYTGVNATLEGLANTQDMNTINAIVRATSHCINNEMSEIRMVWMDESTMDVIAKMGDLV